MKTKLLRLLGVSIGFTVYAMGASAQATSQTQYFVPQPFPRSPGATAFEKYGTYQVNEFTGVPDISIPLYTVEAGGLQVPITLSYHASGNKVTDVSSWVGLGWSLSAGGQVSRRTMGLPDDIGEGYLNGQMPAMGTVDYTTDAGVIFLENASNGTYDTKPDIYSYDFPGHSGKFFFDGSAANGTYPVRMIPYAPVKIQYKLLQHFNITDEHGNRYLYGDFATDSTSSATGGRGTITTQSAWKIENIISQNHRDTILFTYKKSLIDMPAADGECFSVTDQITDIRETGDYTASYTNQVTTPGNNVITNEKDVAQIKFKNGMVVFDLDTAHRTDINVGEGGIGQWAIYGLHDMKVYKYNFGIKNYELQKTIVFWKSYFVDTVGTKRLRLDSVQILDKAGAIAQHYRFDYNTAIALPDYRSKQQDYWGYFNAKNNNLLTPQLIIPYLPNTALPQTNVTIGSNILNGRYCDSNYMQAYILTGIHYPTGGYSTFTYQTNQYYNSGVLQLAGGVRIKTISSYDGTNPTPIVKTYVYNSSRPNFDATSFSSNVNNQYFTAQQTHRYWEVGNFGGGPAIGATAIIRAFNTSPHMDIEGYDGAVVVYPSVTEYIGTPGNNAGRTDYTFTDAKDTLLMASMGGPQIYASPFYRRGHLLTKKEYVNKGGGIYQIVSATTNNYTAFPASRYANVALAVSKTVYNDGPMGTNPMEALGPPYIDDRQTGVFIFNWYNISSDDNYLVYTSTKTYDTNDTTKYTTSTVTYNYDDTTHQQIASVVHADSKGNTHISSTKYAYNYVPTGGTSTGNMVLDSMINRHMYADPVEKWDSLQNVTTSVNAVTSAQLNQYGFGNLSNTIVPSKISTLSVASPLTNFNHSHVVSGVLTGDTRYAQMISFDQYDIKNNITQYTPRNATPTAIMWDYNYEMPVAQVKNAALISVAYTGFEADGKGNWLFSGTPVTDVTAPVGSYVYPLSAGSINSNTLSNTTGYVVSYWSNNGAATVTYQSGSITGSPLRSVNGWTYYEHLLPTGGTSSYVIISGSISIDELRLYPSAAQMTTYAYDPSGVRQIADTKGSINYFEYDYFSRLKNAKDWNGNIVKNYGYHTFDQTIGNDAIAATTFTRDNCPAGTTPQTTTYSVAANTYLSSTKASANAEAAYDLNINGQAKADNPAICGCPITTISYSLSNSTGLSGFQVTFSGIATPFNFPSSGTTVVQVPAGSYSSVTTNSVGSATHTFTMGARPAQSGVHSGSFSSVTVSSSSPDLTLSIN